MNWIRLACSLLAFGILAGAFGAHGLKQSLDPYALSIWEKAVFYHLTQALGLFLVASSERWSARQQTLIASLLAGGISIFSGSLYLLAVTGIKWLGAITPIGGTALIAAWIFAAVSAKQVAPDQIR